MITVVFVCEDQADFRQAAHLADRALHERLAWFESENWEHLRRHAGLDDSKPFVKWTEAVRIARDRGVRASGQFRGEPGDFDAASARRVLLLLSKECPSADVVVLLRDADDQGHERRNGLRQARDERGWNTRVVVGVAHAKREAWVLAGFVSADDEERRRLAVLRNELGFDPTTNAERLDAKADDAKRSAKRVLELLIGGDFNREERCWTETSLAHLRRAGAATGLPEYLQEAAEVMSAALDVPAGARS